jgi:hypothetical protein
MCECTLAMYTPVLVSTCSIMRHQLEVRALGQALMYMGCVLLAGTTCSIPITTSTNTARGQEHLIPIPCQHVSSIQSRNRHRPAFYLERDSDRSVPRARTSNKMWNLKGRANSLFCNWCSCLNRRSGPLCRGSPLSTCCSATLSQLTPPQQGLVPQAEARKLASWWACSRCTATPCAFETVGTY